LSQIFPESSARYAIKARSKNRSLIRFWRQAHQSRNASMSPSTSIKKQMNRSPIFPIVVLMLLLALIRFLSG
jgi:hypothetical protein